MDSYSEIFCREMDDHALAQGWSVDALETALRGQLEAGRAAWPMVGLDAESFVRHLARHLRGEQEVLTTLDQLRGADLYFACACGQGDAPAIALFEGDLSRVVEPAVSRLGLGPAMVDELKQVLLQKLLVAEQGLPKIVEYAGRGPLEGWLRVVAVRAALTLLRKRAGDPLAQQAPPDGTLLDVPALSDSPEMSLIKTRYSQVFNAAIAGAALLLSAQDRTLLRLHFVDGLNFEQIGGIYKTHRSTVSRWIARSRELLFDETRKRVILQLGLTPEEYDSLKGAVESHLHLSLDRVLGADE